MSSKQKRAAVYARFSSKHQREISIDDQIGLANRLAEREGDVSIVATFADRAKTATTTYDRDELADMMDGVQRGKFDMVICEDIDRLARDQEDMIGMYKQMLFFNCEILTRNGIQTAFEVGIRGLFAEMQAKSIGDKVKRHHDERVAEGKIPGAIADGYRKIAGKPGEVEIDPERAPIYLRIFTEYAAQTSPRTMAANLMRDGIPNPSGGKHWHHQTFVGGRLKRGIISNPIYIGQIVWNQSRRMKNPFTKKKVKRPGLKEDLLVVDAPHLRIIPQDLWDACQKVRTDRATLRFGPDGKNVVRRPVLARTQHMLAGLLRCAVCNGPMRIAQQARGGSGRVACAAAHQYSTCEHRKSYDMDVIQAKALTQLEADLADPEEVAAWGAAYAAEFAKGQKDNGRDLAEVTKKINRLENQINRVVMAITDGHAPPELLGPKLKELDGEKQGLLKQREQLQAAHNVVTLHPSVIPDWQRNVRRLGEVLKGPLTPEVRATFRNLVTDIYVYPTPKRAEYKVRLYGRMSALLGVDPFLPPRTTEEIFKDAGAYAVATPAGLSSPGCRYSNSDIVPLGRWKAAA